MATRIIRKYGDDVLRKKSKLVDKFDNRLEILISDMAETMYEAKGVGLAAPQVGILKQVVVIDIGDGLLELINPELVSAEGKVIDVEGCLSVPGVIGEVARPKKVKVKAQDRDGNHINIEGEGLLARALCHEIDHLSGTIFVDKAIRFLEPEGEEE